MRINKPRMLIFSEQSWPEGGGAELTKYILVKDIFSKIFDVYVVSGTRYPHLDMLNSCRYIYWESLRGAVKPVEWLRVLSNVNVFKKLLMQSDIIYIPSHTLLPLAIIVKYFKPNVRVVLHIHNYQPISYTSIILHNCKPSLKNDLIVERYQNNSILRAIATGVMRNTNILNFIALNYADLIICVSRRQYEIITNIFPQMYTKIKIIYNPLPKYLLNDFKYSEPAITYPGGSNYIKGFYTLLACIGKIVKKGLNMRLNLLGRYTSSYFKIVDRLKHHSIYTFGKVSHEEALRIYSRSWGTLLPLISEEPLPYTVIESMAVGTIPIASRVGGIPEIVNGTPAEEFLFNPGDEDSLIDKIETLCSLGIDEMINIGLKLREEAIKKFDIEKIRKDFVRIFNV